MYAVKSNKRNLKKHFEDIKAPLLQDYILGLINFKKVIPRTDIVFWCRFQRKAADHQIDYALEVLREHNQVHFDIVFRPLDFGKDDTDAHYYFVKGFVKAKAARIEKCQKLIQQRLKLLDPKLGKKILETAGQEYVHSLIYHARSSNEDTIFGKGLTPKGRTPKKAGERSKNKTKLGHVKLTARSPIETDEYADLTIEARDIPDVKLLIEVKNRDYSVRTNEVDKLFRQAYENSVATPILYIPVMISSYVEDNVKDYMTARGITYLELGRQILPASVKSETSKLFDTEILDQRFQFVPDRLFRAKNDRKQKLDPRTEADLKVITSPDWILSNLPVWLKVMREVTLAASQTLGGELAII